MKVLKGNPGSKLPAISIDNDFFLFDIKSKDKNKFHTEKLLHRKKNEKATYGMRENTCKLHI